MGTHKPLQVEEEKLDPIQRQQIDQEKEKLIKLAKENYERTKKEKNPVQKIRLICNQITPDNFDKKFDELRLFLFGDLKYSGEAGFEKSKTAE